MVTILMSAKLATPSFLKKIHVEIKVMMSYFLTMTSPTKVYQITQIIL